MYFKLDSFLKDADEIADYLNNNNYLKYGVK